MSAPSLTGTAAVSDSSVGSNGSNSSSSNSVNKNTTSPTKAYQAALNYTLDDSSKKMNKNVAYFKQMLMKFNNSTFIYPTISVVLLTITNLFIIFSKSFNIFIKILCVLVLLIYISFTIYWFKN